MRKVLPLICLSSGLLIIGSVIFPIGKQVLFSPLKLLDPTAVSFYPAPIIVNDYTQAPSWFISDVSLPPSIPSSVTFFTLSLPRLNLINIPVHVNGSDLKKNAIHYPGTALPGDFGNTVIFGHSALPQFYRQDNPLIVFNPIIKAKIGDDITLKYDGVSYRYQVRQITEVKPSQIEVLAQNYSRRDLTLITCTPIGTYWNRFVVRAELVN
jgi:sortase A